MAKQPRIDFTDPKVLLHYGKRIPIATPKQYADVKAEVRKIFTGKGATFSNEDADNLAARVKGGLTVDQIRHETAVELERRFPDNRRR